MRRALETEETLEQAPLLNATGAQTEEVAARKLYTVETLPARRTQTLAEQAARRALPAAQTQAALQEQARRERRKQRERAFEFAVNDDGGPYAQFAAIFETFAIALASGMAMEEALRAATNNKPAPMQALFTDVIARLERGEGLTQALQAHEEELPPVVTPIFEHGLIYGTAENAARQTARALKQLARVEEKFLYSALNPGLWVPLVAGGVMLLAMPAFIVCFANPLIPYLLFCAACMAVSSWAWAKRHTLMQRRWKQKDVARLRLRGPGGGFVSRQMGGARWSRVFAALWNCGVPIGSALEAAGRATRNAHYERLLRDAANATRQGVSLGDALAQQGLLRGEMLNAIKTGETSGELGPFLEQWADVLEDDAKQRGGQMLALYTFGLMFIAALIVCILCLAVLYAVTKQPLPNFD